MKKYEVALKKRMSQSKSGECEPLDYIVVNNYREAVSVAKAKSLKWDECDVVCSTSTDSEDYWQLWVETYVRGSKVVRIKL